MTSAIGPKRRSRWRKIPCKSSRDLYTSVIKSDSPLPTVRWVSATKNSNSKIKKHDEKEKKNKKKSRCPYSTNVFHSIICHLHKKMSTSVRTLFYTPPLVYNELFFSPSVSQLVLFFLPPRCKSCYLF